MSFPSNLIPPPEDDPLDTSWTNPLEAVERAIRGMRRYQFFELGDFMIMGKVLRRPRPDLVLYKHSWTRRYLNLDAEGHAYRYFPPKDLASTRSGQYRIHRDLPTAMDLLRLWELPWMKPDLDEHRYGLTASERWVLDPEELLDDDELGAVGRYRLDCRRWEDEPWPDEPWPDEPWPVRKV